MPDAHSVKRPGQSFSTKSIHPKREGGLHRRSNIQVDRPRRSYCR
jgi:hypothetical protein